MRGIFSDTIGDREEESGPTTKNVSLVVTAAGKVADPLTRSGQVARTGAMGVADLPSVAPREAGGSNHSAMRIEQDRTDHFMKGDIPG